MSTHKAIEALKQLSLLTKETYTYHKNKNNLGHERLSYLQNVSSEISELASIDITKLTLSDNFQKNFLNSAEGLIYFLSENGRGLNNSWNDFQRRVGLLAEQADILKTIKQEHQDRQTPENIKQKEDSALKNQLLDLKNQISDIASTLDSKVLEAVNRKEDSLKIKNVIETQVIDEIENLTTSERDSTHNWLYAGVLFFALSILYAMLVFINFDQITELTKNNGLNQTILNYVLIKTGLRDLFILTGLSTAAMICFSQHKQHKINYASYKHKKFSLRTFESLTSKTLQTDTQNIIVEKAMSAIFLPPEISKDNASENTSNIINFLKSPIHESDPK